MSLIEKIGLLLMTAIILGFSMGMAKPLETLSHASSVFTYVLYALGTALFLLGGEKETNDTHHHD